jgi:hypothetical protein
LLLLQRKIVIEEKPFNSATATRKFQLENIYYLYVNNQLEKIKKSKKGILSGLADQGSLMQDYFSQSKNSGRSEEELIAAIKYYNTIASTK